MELVLYIVASIVLGVMANFATDVLRAAGSTLSILAMQRAWEWIRAHADLVLLALVGLVVVAALIQRDSETVLAYADALAWPIVALVGIIAFRRPVAGLLKDLELKRIAAGPLHAEFERYEQPNELEFDPDAFADEYAPEVEAQALAQAAEAEAETLQRELAQRNVAVTILALLNTAFQNQIDFVKYLRHAPEGLDAAASQAWFRGYLGESADNWDVPGRLQWLVSQGVIEVAPNGVYRLTEQGTLLANAADQFWYAPKLG